MYRSARAHDVNMAERWRRVRQQSLIVRDANGYERSRGTGEYTAGRHTDGEGDP